MISFNNKFRTLLKGSFLLISILLVVFCKNTPSTTDKKITVLEKISGEMGIGSSASTALGSDGSLLLCGRGILKVSPDLKLFQGFTQGLLDTDTTAITLDLDGNIWVTDLYSSRVIKADPAGNVLGAFTTTGTFPGGGPREIITDKNGDIWVFRWNPYATKFDSQGNLLGQFNLPPGQYFYGTIDGFGNILIGAGFYGKAIKIDTFGNVIGEYVTNSSIMNVAVDNEGNIWAAGYTGKGGPDSITSTVTKFSSSGSSLGTFNVGKGLISKIAVDSLDHIWITLFDDKALIKMNTSGVIIDKIKLDGYGISVTIDNLRKIVWVVDSETIWKISLE